MTMRHVSACGAVMIFESEDSANAQALRDRLFHRAAQAVFDPSTGQHAAEQIQGPIRPTRLWCNDPASSARRLGRVPA